MKQTDILWCILAVVFIFCLVKFVFDYDDSVYIKSSIDQREYIIRNKYHSRHLEQETADTLAEINVRIQKLINGMSHSKEHHYVEHLRNNYSSMAISEAVIDDNFTTYTINKKHIHICLRSRDQHKRLYDINDLMYVTIHELAHMCNYTEDDQPINGHGKEFQQKFRDLIQESIKLGIYHYYDYNDRPKEYCGMKITSHILD